MKPGESKRTKIEGGVFTTDEGLTINIPPKNIIEKEVLRKELIKMQEEYLMDIEVVSNDVYKDERGMVVKRTTKDGKILTTELKSKDTGMDR